MNIIIIEGQVFKVSKKVLETLQNKHKELEKEPYRHGKDVEMVDFIDSLKHLFKPLGHVEFDFRL